MSSQKHPVRIAVQLRPQHADYSALRNAAGRAEDRTRWNPLGAHSSNQASPRTGLANVFEQGNLLRTWDELT